MCVQFRVHKSMSTLRVVICYIWSSNVCLVLAISMFYKPKQIFKTNEGSENENKKKNSAFCESETLIYEYNFTR